MTRGAAIEPNAAVLPARLRAAAGNFRPVEVQALDFRANLTSNPVESAESAELLTPALHWLQSRLRRTRLDCLPNP